MKYSAYIFDFDYTLGDATNGIVSSFNYAFGMMGLPLPLRDNIRKTIGLSLPEAFEQLTGIRDELLHKEFVKLFREKADEIMIDNTELFADTIETLEYLKSSKIKTGIVTTKYHYRIDEILKKFNIEHLFDVIVGGEDVQSPKPDPEGLLYAIKALGITKNKVVYIGDSEVDAKTASSAVVDFIAVTTGTTIKEVFLKHPHIGIIEKISDLINASIVND